MAIRTREVLALLRERDGALVLQTMLWPDEVRDAELRDAGRRRSSVRKQEVEMAESYIATLKAEFDPERYHSDYREALERLVEAKVEGLPMPGGRGGGRRHGRGRRPGGRAAGERRRRQEAASRGRRV